MADARLRGAIGMACGFALGALVSALALRQTQSVVPDAAARPASEPSPQSAPAPDAKRLRELEAEVAWWRDAYQDLARADAELGSAPPPGQPTTPAEPPGTRATEAESADFDGATLLGSGYTEQEIQRLRERYEAFERDLLYLGDQARREGWRDEPRYGIGTTMLRDALHSDLGDRDFDALLYAIGRNNRVVVAGVLPDTAAEHAGLRPGDELISYDGRRIFDPQAIVRATAEGIAGRTTELRVRRDGEEYRFLVPRGPIGIRLQPERRAPEGFR